MIPMVSRIGTSLQDAGDDLAAHRHGLKLLERGRMDLACRLRREVEEAADLGLLAFVANED